jgi:hypothetical protein
MSKSKTKLIVAAISALMTEVLMPNLIPTASAAALPQFDLVSVRLDRTMASNSAATPSATVMYTGGTVCVATPASGTFSTIPNAGTETNVEIGFPAEQGSGVTAPISIGALTDFQVKATPANWIVNTTDLGSGNSGQHYFPLLDGLSSVTAWPISSPATAAQNTNYTPGDVASKRIVRFTMPTSFSAGTEYCFNFKDGTGTTGAETNATYSLQLPDIGTNGYQENVPGFVTTYKCTTGCTALGAGTPIMSSNWGTQITSASTTSCTVAPCNDYYVVSAVVPPLLIFTLDHNADSFVTNLDPNQAVLTNGVTAKIQTNGKGGWVMWTKDTDRSGLTPPQNVQGLHSAASGGIIPTTPWLGTGPTTIYTSPTQPAAALYGLIATATSNVGGTTACGASNTPAGAKVELPYAGSNVSPVSVGAFTVDWAEVADCSASTAGTDGGSTVLLKEAATITFSTPASTDYTDTVYVAAAGQF